MEKIEMCPANPNMVRHSTNHVNASNPVFAREEVKMPRHDSPGQAEQAQMGKVPLPSTQSPMLNEHIEDIAPAGTVYLDSKEQPVAVSDGSGLVPINLDLQPHHIDGSGPLEDEDAETEEEVESAAPPSDPPAGPAPVEETEPATA